MDLASAVQTIQEAIRLHRHEWHAAKALRQTRLAAWHESAIELLEGPLAGLRARLTDATIHQDNDPSA
jgi:hypothetical protein